VVAVVAALAVAAGILVLALRGPGPEDVAAQALAATWEGDPRTECELATEQWRRYLYEGHPFANSAQFAKAAAEAGEDNPFAPFRDDTDIEVTVEPVSEGDGKARVAYVVELDYRGDDRVAFDDLWAGGGPVDRGTVELVEVDGEWRVAGVDAG
jgi:hypothetical protein